MLAVFPLWVACVHGTSGDTGGVKRSTACSVGRDLVEKRHAGSQQRGIPPGRLGYQQQLFARSEEGLYTRKNYLSQMMHVRGYRLPSLTVWMEPLAGTLRTGARLQNWGGERGSSLGDGRTPLL